jgi:hypothetical protein
MLSAHGLFQWLLSLCSNRTPSHTMQCCPSTRFSRSLHSCLHPDIHSRPQPLCKNCQIQKSSQELPAQPLIDAAIIAQTSKHRTLISILNTTFSFLPSELSMFPGVPPRNPTVPLWKYSSPQLIQPEFFEQKREQRMGNYFTSSPARKLRACCHLRFVAHNKLLWPRHEGNVLA